MRSSIVLLTCWLTFAHAQRQTLDQAAVHARELIAYRAYNIGVLTSNYSPLTSPPSVPERLIGEPIGLPEYYVSYPTPGSADLLLLALPISVIYRNALAPNNNSMTLTVSDSLGLSQNSSISAGRMRLALFGEIERVTGVEEIERCKQAYLQAHPEAKYWVAADGPHYSYFVRFRLNSIYFFGGFGNVSYIGWIPLELFRSSQQYMRSRKEVEQTWPDPFKGLEGLDDEDEEARVNAIWATAFDERTVEAEFIVQI